MLGKIIFSSSREVEVRLDERCNVEDLKLGNLVLINSDFPYLARISELYTKNLGESALADRIAALNSKNSIEDVESIYGPQFYYVLKASLVGVLSGNRLMGAKSIPKIFSQVERVRESDLHFLKRKERNYIQIGRLRDMQLPVNLDLKTFVEKHSGVFGKTGSGKSNTVKIILKESLQKIGCILFDVHSEYGFSPKGLGGMKNVVVLGLEGSEHEISVSIPYTLLRPGDLKILTELTEAQEEAIYMIKNKSGKKWVEYLRDVEPEKIVSDFSNQIRDSTINALKRKLRGVLSYRFIGEEFDSLRYIFQKLRGKKTLIVEFGDFEHDDRAIKLITSLISRYLLERFMSAKRRGDEVSETLIVLEEAHKLLSREIARRTVFSRIVREGRKFGLGLCVVDQMPRKISEEVISQLNTVIIMLLTNLKDREHLILSSENDLSDFKEEMRRLDVGEAIICGISVPMPIPASIEEFQREFLKDVGEDDFEWN
ncbi:MAG: ATP-binding protein [Candidatus Methanofastidiosia archaeon]